MKSNQLSESLNERIENVIDACSREWGCTVDALKSHRRHSRCTVPRHAAMKILRADLGLSLAEIGHVFDKHHTSVLFAIKQHGERMESKEYAEKFSQARTTNHTKP